MVKEHLGLYTSDDGILHFSKWVIAESSVAGRGLFATEDILPGEVLFVDHPLISGPRAASIEIEPHGCTVCCKIDAENTFKCPKCGLLLCSEQCQSDNVHFNDCNVISRWVFKIPVEDFDYRTVPRALTAIRALLLNDDQKQLLSALQAHVLPQHGTEIRDLQEYFEIPESEVEFMRLACCVLDANAYQIATAYGKKEMSRRGLYPVSALMNHNCVPNTKYSYNSEAQMTVKASNLLPIQPLNTTSAWQCLECGLRVPRKNIGAVQSAVGSLLGSVNFGSVDSLEKFLTTRITKYIPKTNQVVVDLQCCLIWEFGEAEGLRWHELSEGRLALKESLCRGTLRTAAALGAGDAHLRGRLLYHLHAALAERARRCPDQYEELKPEIESTIEQAYSILQGDISAPPDLDLRHLGFKINTVSKSARTADGSSQNIIGMMNIPVTCDDNTHTVSFMVYFDHNSVTLTLGGHRQRTPSRPIDHRLNKLHQRSAQDRTVPRALTAIRALLLNDDQNNYFPPFKPMCYLNTEQKSGTCKNTLKYQKVNLLGSVNFGSVDSLEKFLTTRITKYIPKTNQVVVDLQCCLIWEFGEAEGLRWHELSEGRLALKESLCRGTLRTAAALGAGDAHLRGRLLYHLHAALAERARRCPDQHNVKNLMFIPYAQNDFDGYTAKIKQVIDPWGFNVTGLHSYPDPEQAVYSAKAIFIGGGNTFLLLKRLYENNLVNLIKTRVDEGNLLYIGSSAGTNVATKSIHTTNDMPIIFPPTFEAISIVPFNINPHYIDKVESETHKGETRDQRIEEYIEMPHAAPVLGLREGSILHVNGNQLAIKGIAGAVLFKKGDKKTELAVGEDVSFLCRYEQDENST
ncbi:hypothetical protein MSG28_002394 [Choristoneura fumiferana]|uniref:Uncharacterized protein n=1 Tax=Choristoneura fumiferana TaxID=7141 RepID=A0ACC0JVS2_CHOFU|nr:hypothetical protein MSG28_002394 [Choristoneura fumiferana]